jgi:hypothetical protein
MIFNFEPPKGVVLDLAQPPMASPYRECHALGWILTGPLLVPGGTMYGTCLVNQKDDRDFLTFLEITPEKAVARALEAARAERKAA